MQRGESRRRWTDGFDGDELGVYRNGERDCDGCGASRPDQVIVTHGWHRGADTERRLACACGRTWWQVSVGG